MQVSGGEGATGRRWLCGRREGAGSVVALRGVVRCAAGRGGGRGCAVGPNYRVPEVAVPGAYGAASATGTGAGAATGSVVIGPGPGDASAGGGGSQAGGPAGDVDLTQWWRALKDSELDSLIDRAMLANPDVEIALTRLQEVRTQEAAHISAALPTIAGSAAGGRGTGSDLSLAGAPPALREADNKGDLSQIRQVAGFSASWELDLFGGYRRAIEAGKYDVGAAAAARNVVLVSVIADVARHYVDLRGLQARLVILRANIAVAAQSRDLEQVRFDRGLTNELDLQLANRELATLRAQEPLLVSGISATRAISRCCWGCIPRSWPPSWRDPSTSRMCLSVLHPGCRSTCCGVGLISASRNDSWRPLQPGSGWRRPACFHACR